MTTLTTPEAQKFLAEQLKELIFLHSDGSFYWYESEKGRDRIGAGAIIDTEFDSIARLVEGKLADRQWEEYNVALYEIWVQERPVKCRFELWLIKLDYVQRATALKQTIGE